jgi:hypothetical protein
MRLLKGCIGAGLTIITNSLTGAEALRVNKSKKEIKMVFLK